MNLEEMLPSPDFSERHGRLIATSRAETWNAMMAVRPVDLPVTCALMGVRLLPAILKLDLKRQRSMLRESFVENAPIPVLSMAEGRSVLTGGALQPWKLRGGDVPPRLDAAGVAEFDEPGWVKCGMDFVLTEVPGGTYLSTETRITATDPETRTRFGRYWTFVRPGSAVIRLELLRAARRKAEG